MINRMTEHPMEHYLAEERRQEMMAAAARSRLATGVRDHRTRRLRRLASGWVSRVLPGRPS
ncbi:MAG TPA: hypothetical protein VK611_19255 [Acidimicrobiales bacterium]|nr:hypothetical protein [Acidimicrobiales bacterium]